MSAVIAMQGVTYGVRQHFWKRDKVLLHDVSFEVNDGEMFGFLGPNGAGKTTSIKVLLGLLAARKGHASIMGRDVRDAAARAALGYLPERSYYPGHFSAREMVLQQALLAGMTFADAKARTHAVLEQVGLAAQSGARLATYSKGMLQRAGLAQAIVARPKVAIFDEPMSGLDPLGRRDVRELMLQLKREGTTLFFSTHILPDVELICDRVAILVGGAVRRVGALTDMLKDGEGGIEVSADHVEAQQISGVVPSIRATKPYAGGVSFELPNIDQANVLIDHVRKSGGTIRSVQTLRGSLEDIFVQEAKT